MLIYVTSTCEWASLVAQLVKNPPAMWETWVWSLGWEDPLKKGDANHSSILAWRIPWTLQSVGSQRGRHNWVTFTFTFYMWVENSHVIRCIYLQMYRPFLLKEAKGCVSCLSPEHERVSLNTWPCSLYPWKLSTESFVAAVLMLISLLFNLLSFPNCIIIV